MCTDNNRIDVRLGRYFNQIIENESLSLYGLWDLDPPNFWFTRLKRSHNLHLISVGKGCLCEVCLGGR
jgi:hypothetical protein